MNNPFNSEEEIRNNQAEFKLQCHIIERHYQYFPHVLITHVPNRGSDARDGFFKKMMGVRPGVSDIVLWWGFQYPEWVARWLLAMQAHLGFCFSRMHSGVVELKVRARVSGAQNKFLSAIASLGGRQGVARSWRQYYYLLCSWGIKPVKPCTIFDEPDYQTKQEKKYNAYEFYKRENDDERQASIISPESGSGEA